ncbi:hypothetical protein R1flu_010885 [Riccia fluitans]|uniref:AT-hook motif nuclear-localized protein n=1 Tax=Riccia fluitans TaxID=41844 RepID=A0ABD1Z6D1_9MARC
MQDTACILTSMIPISESNVPAQKKKRGRPKKIKDVVEDNLVIAKPAPTISIELPTLCPLPPPSNEENMSVEELSGAAALTSTGTTPVSETAPGEVVAATPSELLFTHTDEGITGMSAEEEPIESQTDEQMTPNASKITVEQQFPPQVTVEVQQLTRSSSLDTSLDPVVKRRRGRPLKNQAAAESLVFVTGEKTPAVILTQVTPVSETAPAEIITVTPLEPQPSNTEEGMTGITTEDQPMESQTDDKLTQCASQVTVEQQLSPQVTVEVQQLTPASSPGTSPEPAVKWRRGHPPKNQAAAESIAPVSGEKSADNIQTSSSDPERNAKRPRGRPKGPSNSKGKNKSADDPSWPPPPVATLGTSGPHGPDPSLGAGEIRKAVSLSSQVLKISPGEDTREIVSMTGYYVPVNESSWSSRLNVALAGSRGQVIGGGVSGSMIAASTVQVIVGSLLTSNTSRKAGPDSAE